MTKKSVVIAMALCILFAGISYAAEKDTAGTKARNFWQKLFNYPANVTNESVTVATDAAKNSTTVVTKEVKTVGKVTSGEFEKTKDLVVEPIKGTADTTVKAVQGVAAIPVNAAKEEKVQ